MKKLSIAVGMSFFWLSIGAVAQEHKHGEHKEEQKAPLKKTTEPAKSDGMKCCEGMEKMSEMKAGMPMKSEMKGDMKAKMEQMKAMQEKIDEKMSDKGVKTQTQESKDEKSQPMKDAHQH